MSATTITTTTDAARAGPPPSLSLQVKASQPSDPPIKLVLASGDIVLFGGPARHCLHAVDKIHQGTCPPALAALDAEMRVSTEEEGWA